MLELHLLFRSLQYSKKSKVLLFCLTVYYTKVQLVRSGSGQVLHCIGISSMADAVCGALQEALLLCEPCLASGRRQNLASPYNMTEEVSSLLLPEFSAFKAEMVKWNKCMSLSSFKLRVGNKPSFISSCISKGMQLTLLRVFVPGCKEGIGSKCSAAKYPLVIFFSLFAGVKCLYLAHLRLLSWKWFY